MSDLRPMGPLDWAVLVTQIPDNGLVVDREATPEERAALVDQLDIVTCDRLRFEVRVRSNAGGRYRVTGRLRAKLAQASVVSLDPVDGSLDEAIDVEYRPADQIAAPDEEEREILSGEDPEPIVSGRIELGRLAFEIIAASLDPYPRNPDEAIAEEGVTAAPRNAGPSGPFAALAQLKVEKD